MTPLKYILENIKNLCGTKKGIISFLLGIFWVFIYIFTRFFYEFTGYQIIELKQSINIFVLFSFIFFTFINFAVLVFVFLKYYKFFFNKQTSPFVKKLSFYFLFIIDVVVWHPLESLYKIIEQDVPGSGLFFLFLERKYFVTPWERETPKDSAYYTYVVIFIFDLLPKIVPSIIFFIEVTFYNQVIYFFYFLPLFFLPVLLNITLKLMESFGTNCINAVSVYFVSTELAGDKKKVYGCFDIASLYKLEVNKEYEGLINPTEEHFLILRAQNILMQTYIIKLKKEKLTLFILIFTSILYFIAGFFRLYLIFN